MLHSTVFHHSCFSRILFPSFLFFYFSVVNRVMTYQCGTAQSHSSREKMGSNSIELEPNSLVSLQLHFIQYTWTTYKTTEGIVKTLWRRLQIKGRLASFKSILT